MIVIVNILYAGDSPEVCGVDERKIFLILFQRNHLITKISGSDDVLILDHTFGQKKKTPRCTSAASEGLSML
jgi:hypothetical protein